MQITPRIWWEEIRNSLWFVPALFTVLALTLTFVTTTIDGELVARSGGGPSWVFGGGAEGARGVLSAIAGSLITVTGVVFSVTVVALQLASSQFTPRVLRNFMGDPANQTVLGVFIGTFTYALLVLRSVRSEAENGGFVPALSVTTAIVLALVSVGFLIYFIDHTARSIQASNIIDRTARQALDVTKRAFPEDVEEPPASALVAPTSTVRASVNTSEAGYVQRIDLEELGKVSEKARLNIEVLPRVGEHLLPGATIAVAWPVSNLDEDTREAIGRCVVRGRERSASADVEFALTRLADIAVKALSPGINDPTTARISVDRLAEVLVMLGNRPMPTVAARGDGEQSLALIHLTTYERCAEAAFGDISHFGAAIPSFVVYLLRALEQASALVLPDRGLVLARQADSLMRSALQRTRDSAELEALREAGGWVGVALDSRFGRDSQESAS